MTGLEMIWYMSDMFWKVKTVPWCLVGDLQSNLHKTCKAIGREKLIALHASTELYQLDTSRTATEYISIQIIHNIYQIHGHNMSKQYNTYT